MDPSEKGRVKNFLTQGHHDVTRILGHRTDLRTAFYIGTLDEKPGDRHIFSIPDIHSASARIPSCLTCNQTDRNCSFHDASFSHKSSYFILRCLGSGAPWTEIRSVEDNQISKSLIMTWSYKTSITVTNSFPSFFIRFTNSPLAPKPYPLLLAILLYSLSSVLDFPDTTSHDLPVYSLLKVFITNMEIMNILLLFPLHSHRNFCSPSFNYDYDCLWEASEFSKDT